ncbi:MAG: SDR family oxidoreductase [Candidatus Omnitrophica bacterium]|nr:SDR family oxidoreductase [Candidatus Omnitrophota bacterium]MDD5488144.1 SDR family oxidoreductase [Candidatus Omnitrophota bacterium]
MDVVVTGGAGFLGSHLCERLLGDNNRVICVDNLITGKMENISHLEGKKGFVFLKADVSSALDIEGNVDRVMHFASPASPVDYIEYPIETLKVGSFGTYNCLELAREKGASFFMASTSEVYGDPEVNPQPETYWGNVNPVGPRAVYDEAKRFSEAMTSAYRRKYGMDTKIVRIFNTYGERMRLDDGRVVPNLICQALRNEPMTVYGDGRQTRSFCYVSDLVEGITRFMVSDLGGPMNIGNPRELSIMEFAEKIKEITGTGSRIIFKPLPENDPKIRRPDISKAGKELGWEPKVSLEEGLKRTLEWFRPRSV